MIKEVGIDYLTGNSWEKEFSGKGNYKNFPTREHGKITEGPDKDHEWQTTFQRDKKGNVLFERGEILAQGINPGKSPTDHLWEKKHFYNEKGKRRGAIGRKKNSGEEPWTYWVEGEISEEEQKESFPEE